jgi:extracellular factor (EF) 3-hydroxypalmitic acid methyl ester biosynthesis protein
MTLGNAAHWIAPSHRPFPILVRRDEAEELWDAVEPRLLEFKALVHEADRGAIRRGSVSIGSRDGIAAAFEGLERSMNEAIGDAASGSEASKKTVGARLQSELLPYLLMSENADRWYSKPRGYAGDFLAIARIYDDEPRGVGRVGAILDRCFLDLAAARAVRNRRGVLSAEIRATIEARGERGAAVTSLACGPAQELFDVYDSLPQPRVLQSTLLDIDLQALAHVADRRDGRRLKSCMALQNENLVHLATGKRRTALVDQDLVYSVGLIDYFGDEMVVRLMNFVHTTLRPGGRIILGNFHPRNPTKAVMDHVLDWKLVHRTEDDMHRLFRASAFGRPATRVLYEAQGINLFAECTKE